MSIKLFTLAAIYAVANSSLLEKYERIEAPNTSNGQNWWWGPWDVKSTNSCYIQTPGAAAEHAYIGAFIGAGTEVDYRFKVWDVWYANQETDTSLSGLINGATIRVGDSPSPWLNPVCATPTDTGLYDCNGAEGKYIFLYKNVAALADKRLVVCALRAYSAKHNFVNRPYPQSSNYNIVGYRVGGTNEIFQYQYGARKQTACVSQFGSMGYRYYYMGTEYWSGPQLEIYSVDTPASYVYMTSVLILFDPCTPTTMTQVFFSTIEHGWPKGAQQVRLKQQETTYRNYDSGGARSGTSDGNAAVYWGGAFFVYLSQTFYIQGVLMYSFANQCHPANYVVSFNFESNPAPVTVTRETSFRVNHAEHQIGCPYVYRLQILQDGKYVPAPDWMTYNINSGMLKVFVDSRTVSGTYYVYLLISSVNEDHKGMIRHYLNSSLTVTQPITSVAFASPSITITLAPAFEATYTTPELSIVPTGGFQFFNWSITGQPNLPSFFIPMVNSMRMTNETPKYFRISTASTSGTWTITITAELDTSGGIGYKATYVVNLVILECAFTSMALAPNSLSVSVLGPSALTTLSYTLNYAACGTATTLIDANYTDLLSAGANSIVAEAPQNYATGQIIATITLRLDLDNSIQTSQQLTVTITPCQVTGLVLSIASTTSVQVGINPQPVTIPFSGIMTPACGYVTTFSLNVSPPSFVTFDAVASYVVVSGAVKTDHSTNQLTLKADVDGQTFNQPFEIKIIDPCSATTFETDPSPLTNMAITLPSSSVLTQAVKIWTALERAHNSLVCPITAVFTPSYPHITLSGDLTTISVNGLGLTGAVPASVQTFVFTLTINSLDFPTSVPEQSYSISVAVTCVVQSIAFTTTPAQLTRIFVGVDQQPYSVVFALAMTPACPTSPTIANTQLPSFIRKVINNDTTSGYLEVDQATLANVGTTDVTLSISSGLGSQSSSFKIEIVDPCAETTFVTEPSPIPATLQVQLASSSQRLITVKVWTPVEKTTNPAVVCPITATLSPFHAFISLAPDFASITIDEAMLTSQIPSSVQNYAFTLVVDSLNHPQVPQVSFDFTIEVTCLITAIAFDSPATTTTITVGIGPQTQSFTFSVLTTPACPTQVSFTKSQSLPFLTLVTQSLYASTLSLQGLTVAHHGTYSINLTAAADSSSATAGFSIIIIDPCSTTTFETDPSPLTNMAITLPSSSVLTQAVKIWTALERAHNSLVCPITAVFTPSYPHITFSGDLTTISVNGLGLTGAVPASVQTFVFTLTINSLDFPTSVPEQSYSISVAVTCVVQSIAFTTTPAQLTRVFVGVDQQPYSVDFALAMTPACPTSPTIANTQLPSFIRKVINNDTTSGYLEVDQATLANVGTTDVTLSISSGLGSQSSSFKIEIVDPCAETTFVTEPSPIPATIQVQLASSAQTTIGVKVYTVAEKTTPTVICPITATLSPFHAFISLAPDFASITIDEAMLTSQIPSSVQNYAFTLVVDSLNHPQVPQVSFDFTIEVTCLITAIAFDSPATTTTITVGIGPQTQSFTFSVLTTPTCPTQVSFAKSQSLPFLAMQTQSLYSFTLSLQDVTADYHDTYSINFTATADSSLASTSFSITIFDPCSNTSFETTPLPLVDMPVMLVSSRQQTQAVKIYTAIERQYSNVICPVQVDLQPALLFITLSSDFTLITVDEAHLTSQIPSSVQTYQFTVTVNHFAVYATQVPQVQFMIKVIVNCHVEQVRLVSKNISDQTIEINPTELSPLVLRLPDYEVLPCFSSKPHTREVKMVTSATVPSFLSYSDNNGSVYVQVSDPYTTGHYEFKVLATEPTSGIFNEEVVFTITFTCTVTSFSNSLKNVSLLNYVIPFDLQSVVSIMPMPIYETIPAYCLITPIDFKLLVINTGTTKSNENFIWNDQNSIWVHAINPVTSGSYVVTIKATETRFGFVDQSVMFNINISCEITNMQPVYTTFTVFELQYKIGSGIASLPLPSYSWIPSTCEKQLEYQLHNESGGKLLPFMQVDFDKMLVTLNGNYEHESYADKLYSFRFVAQTQDGRVKNSDYRFTITTTFEKAAQGFVVSIPWQQNPILDVQTETSIQSDSLNQTDNINMTDNSNQTQTLNETNSLNQTDLNETGDSNRTENLTSVDRNKSNDSTGSFDQASIGNFSAQDKQQSQSESDKAKNETNPADVEIPKVTVQAQMPAFATKKIEKMPVLLPIKPKAAKGPDEPLSVYFTGQEFGTGVMLDFSAPMDFRDFQDPTSIFEVVLEPLQEMDRKLQASSNEPVSESLPFSWSIEKISQTQIKLDVHLDRPYDISTGSTIHVITVRVAPSKIKSTSGKKLADTQSFSKKLPSQMREEDVSMVQATTEASSGMTLGAMLGSFFVSMLVMQALNLLFGMVGSLQFILYMAILNVNFPGNSNALFKQLFEVLSFDIIPDSLMQPWYDLVSKNTEVKDVSDKFNQRFDQMSYASSNWVINMGSATIFAIILIGQYMILPCFTRTRLLDLCQIKVCRTLKGKLTAMEKQLYWNESIRFVIELFFELTLICAIRVKTNETDTRSEMILTRSAQVMLGLLVLFNWFVAYISVEHKRRWKLEEVASRFGTLYEDINPSVSGSYYNMSIFLLGRLVFVGALVFLQDYPYFQLAIVTWISLAQSIFAVRMPLEDKLENELEIMNQCGSLVVCDLFFQLSDNVPDGETRYFIGWIISGLVVILIAVNLIFINGMIIRGLIHGARHSVARRRNARRSFLLRIVCKCLGRQRGEQQVRVQAQQSAHEDLSVQANLDEENSEEQASIQEAPVLRIRPLPPGRTHNFGRRPQTRAQEPETAIQLVLDSPQPTVYEDSEQGFYDLFDYGPSLEAHNSRNNSSYASWQIEPIPKEDFVARVILKETEQLALEMRQRFNQGHNRETTMHEQSEEDIVEQEIRFQEEHKLGLNTGLPKPLSSTSCHDFEEEKKEETYDEECIYNAPNYYSKAYTIAQSAAIHKDKND